jgi:hypothetical protein
MVEAQSKTEKSDIRQMCRYAISFAVAAIYFFYWNWKTPVRNALRRSSLWVLSLFTAFIVAEVASEFWHEQLLQWVVAMIHEYHRDGLYFFVAAVLFLLWHHRHERKKPEYEYRFLQRLYETIEHSRKEPKPASEVLEIIHSAFGRSCINHVSIHTPKPNDTLEILTGNVFPPLKEGSDYFVPLKIGHGVGGRVFVDRIPRYMPRLYFPNWRRGVRFGHAVQLAFQEPKVGRLRKMVDQIRTKLFTTPRKAPGGLDLAPDGFNLNVYEDSGKSLLFHSILCVPLKSMTTDRCLGVLNLDFDSTDPLDKGDIAMAIIFGIVLGDIVDKQQVTPSRIAS